jgi:hypothetical protein
MLAQCVFARGDQPALPLHRKQTRVNLVLRLPLSDADVPGNRLHAPEQVKLLAVSVDSF